jgi:tetratricopeptide (TPR) repeat protein
MEHPWTPWAMQGLAGVYVQLGRRKDALPLYDELIKLDLAVVDKPESDASTLNNAAWGLLMHSFEELRDPERALTFAERACSKEQASGGGNLWKFLDTLALAQHRTGDTAKAIETAKRAISLIPDGANEATITEIKTNLRTYEAALAEPSGDNSATQPVDEAEVTNGDEL